MAVNITQTSIANRALQILGYEPISSIQENSRGARAINRAYYPVLYAELRQNFWNFSIKRAILAASSTQPLFGKANYYPLPADFLDLAMPDQITTYNYGAIPNVPNSSPAYEDYQIENMGNNTLAIASNMSGPLYIRYVSSNVSEGNFDHLFSESFAASLAMEVCEELTQSNSKMAMAQQMYTEAIEMAKKRNSFEMKPVEAPVDRYITVRM